MRDIVKLTLFIPELVHNHPYVLDVLAAGEASNQLVSERVSLRRSFSLDETRRDDRPG